MSRFATLNSNTDFRRAYGRGKAYTNPALVTYVVKNRAGICRIGITTSKKIGNAVERNRARRVIREAYRTHMNNLQGGFDIVFVARTKTVHKKSTDISAIMRKHLITAGVIKDVEESGYGDYPILPEIHLPSFRAEMQILSDLFPLYF